MQAFASFDVLECVTAGKILVITQVLATHDAHQDFCRWKTDLVEPLLDVLTYVRLKLLRHRQDW